MNTLQEAAASLPPEIAELAGLVPASQHGHGLFCGVPEPFAIGGVRYQWPRGSTLAWGIGFSRLGGLSDMDCKDAIEAGCKEISDCCDLQFKYVSDLSKANVKMTTARMDGPGGTLADAMLPVGRNVSTKNTQLTMRFDDRERYVLAENPSPGTIDFYRVNLHEWGHIGGMGHKPAGVRGRALIEAMYSDIRHLQPLDKEEWVIRYGEATGTVDPKPPSDDGIWVFIPGGRTK